ncbi:hypothetical protein EV421DRAFT_2024364 [Armillaria borealis]|uniref:Uncharacterized protein n=1 Tax=Armillaria borealis TaxID=47425 RepID=A0AA39MFD6_9AGAR|nr:hypothetical protein EV421DRAFT_2024364 [Armillaria borealis]
MRRLTLRSGPRLLKRKWTVLGTTYHHENETVEWMDALPFSEPHLVFRALVNFVPREILLRDDKLASREQRLKYCAEMTGHHPACKATRTRQYADQALVDGLLPLIVPQDSRRRIIVPEAGAVLNRDDGPSSREQGEVNFLTLIHFYDTSKIAHIRSLRLLRLRAETKRRNTYPVRKETLRSLYVSLSDGTWVRANLSKGNKSYYKYSLCALRTVLESDSNVRPKKVTTDFSIAATAITPTALQTVIKLPVFVY